MSDAHEYFVAFARIKRAMGAVRGEPVFGRHERRRVPGFPGQARLRVPFDSAGSGTVMDEVAGPGRAIRCGKQQPGAS
jgi:hypothetical protein